MIITIKTAVTFRLPKEKALMEQFEQNNSDWVLDDDLASMWHYTPTTNTATYRRTQMFEVGADWKGGDAEMSPLQKPTTTPMQQSPNNGADLISRADAIEAVCDNCGSEKYCDRSCQNICVIPVALSALPSAEIAETDPIVIRNKTLMPTKDFKEWAKRVREENPNVIVIPCDAEVVSAEDVDIHKAHEEEHLNIVNRIKELQYAIAKTQTIAGKMVESAEADRPTGEWILDEDADDVKCSVCGHLALLRVAIGDVGLQEYSNFCPNCGARMENTNE